MGVKSLSNQGSLPAQDPCHPKIPVIPRSQSTQDPCQPKIPVSPRSQSALNAFMPIWLMPIWYLAHAIKFFKHILHTYLDFSHAYLAHSHFSLSKKLISVTLLSYMTPIQLLKVRGSLTISPL